MTIVEEEMNDLSLGIDLKLRWNRLLFQFEAASDERRYSDRGRPAHIAVPGALQPDSRTIAAYAILGHQFDYMGTVLWLQSEHTGSNNTVPTST